METETIKKRRGPRPGTQNFISVPLVDLIKLCAASISIPVNRKWAISQGYTSNMEIPPLSTVLASKEIAAAAKPMEEKMAENSSLKLQVQEIGEEDFN